MRYQKVTFLDRKSHSGFQRFEGSGNLVFVWYFLLAIEFQFAVVEGRTTIFLMPLSVFSKLKMVLNVTL